MIKSVPRRALGVLPTAVGALANVWIRQRLQTMLNVVPGSIQSYGLGIVSGALLTFVPRYGNDLAAGAMTGEVLRAINQYVKPGLQLMGMGGDEDYPYSDGMDGLDEMITPGAGLNELVAPGMEEFFEGQGISDTTDALETMPAAEGSAPAPRRKRRGMSDDGDDFE